MSLESMEKIQTNVNEEEKHMQKVEEEWRRTSNRMEEIRSAGGFSALATEYPKEIKEIVSHEGECVFCMDGRVAPKENGVAIAGSGILIKNDPIARDLLVRTLRAQGIHKVFLHEDCGAVGLYAATRVFLRNVHKKMHSNGQKSLLCFLEELMNKRNTLGCS